MTAKDEFKLGRNYCLIVEDQREAVAFLKRVLSTKVPCMVVTTTHPRKLQEDHGLEGAQMIWVTDEGAKGYRSIPPGRMRFELTKELLAFITAEGASVVFIEGIEYLTLLNGFDAVMSFVKQLCDKASACGDSLVVPLSRGSMPEAQFIVFKGRFDRSGGPADIRIPGEAAVESSGPAALADQVLASMPNPPAQAQSTPLPAPMAAPDQAPVLAAVSLPSPPPPPPPPPHSSRDDEPPLSGSLLEQVARERKTKSH